MNAQEIADRLAAKSSGPAVWNARCPAHDDKDPSLSIAVGETGGVVLYCHAGCSTIDILAKLGLTMVDLAPPKLNGEVMSTYRYTDETGTLLFEVVRKPGKKFLQRRPDGMGGWIWKIDDTRRVLYHLPRVIKAVANGNTVFICEGEKDADRIIAEGYCATTNPMGAGKWSKVAGHAQKVLAGADVIVIRDRDGPGNEHAAEVVASLQGVAASVLLVEPMEGKDASDHLAAGHTVDDFIEIDIDDTKSEPPSQDDSDPLEHSTWQAVDLADALAGIDVPPPTILARTDGVCLLYSGRTHGFVGESETCKSWVAQIAATQVIQAGQDVLWIDFEDDDRGVVSRLLAVMVSPQVIRTRFIYVRPEEPLRTKTGAWTAGGVDFDEVLASRPWTLIVIDGVTEAMVTEGLDLNSNSDIATWSRLLPKKCANTGAAVVMLDHVPKSAENRGRYALGGQHKLAGLTGCQYVFDTERQFSRATIEPVVGVIKITVEKDRPGHVRTHAREKVIARMELTSYPDGAVTAALLAPNDSNAPLDLVLATHIAEHLDVYPKSSKNSIEKTLGGNASALRRTLEVMVTNGWVTVESKGQSHLHTLTDTGSEYFNA